MIGFVNKNDNFALTNQAVGGFSGFLVNSSSGNVTATLPSPSSFRDGQIFVVVKNDDSSNKVRVETQDQQPLDDNDNFLESDVPYSHIMLTVIDGRWRILMNDNDNFTVP